MRKNLYNDFNKIYVVDLQGNVRRDSMRDGIPIGEANTVFGLAAMVGISITILIKKKNEQKHQLNYFTVDWKAKRKEKFEILAKAKSLSGLDCEVLQPSNKNVWLVSENVEEFESFIPIGSKEDKRAKYGEAEAIFKTYSGGIKSNADDYIYDFSHQNQVVKAKAIVEDYQSQLGRWKVSKKMQKPSEFLKVDETTHKWVRKTKRYLKREIPAEFNPSDIRTALYRPFTKRYQFFHRMFNEEIYRFDTFLPDEEAESTNRVIIVSDVAYRATTFSTLISNHIPELHLTASSDSHQCFPFYVYDKDGSNRRENITDWALSQFRAQYPPQSPHSDGGKQITKWDIFYYVYALLHHPEYRERYADNLKRELPRIPFVPATLKSPPDTSGGDLEGGFWAFSDAGKKLAKIHLNYETCKGYPVEWVENRELNVDYRVEKMRPIAKRDVADGNYKVYDALKYNEFLTITGIPEKAFAYRLGNRSAIDWIVDQYRVKTDKRSGIVSDPNGYSDDEQYILHLLGRVIQVSVDTVDIVNELAKLPFRED